MDGAALLHRFDPHVAWGAPADVEVRLPAAAATAREARRCLRALPGPRLRPDRLSDCLLAVSEAVNNAVLHGDASEGATVVVKAWNPPGGLLVLVADAGAGFVPGSPARGPRTGLGMGLTVIRALADRVGVRSRIGCTLVLMAFLEHAPPPADTPAAAAATPEVTADAGPQTTRGPAVAGPLVQVEDIGLQWRDPRW